ncbi:MAG TPA: oligoribonuclease [Patescibacteria group bacterium]|jgi:oligoribonuclease|nr:oligoribonuclease [Patescibacteria group bacterium]
MDIHKLVPTKLLWVDLEMTGLDPAEDLILEVAAEVTDFDFKTLANYEGRVKHDVTVVLERMQKSHDWWSKFPENRDDFIKKLNTGKSSQTIEQDLIALIAEWFKNEPAILAGNSIHNDRNFIKHYWPALDLKLHYRMLDVSAFKVLMMGKYKIEFEKQNSHRAYDDIQASIAELQYYLDWFKNDT